MMLMQKRVGGYYFVQFCSIHIPPPSALFTLPDRTYSIYVSMKKLISPGSYTFWKTWEGRKAVQRYKNYTQGEIRSRGESRILDLPPSPQRHSPYIMTKKMDWPSVPRLNKCFPLCPMDPPLLQPPLASLAQHSLWNLPIHSSSLDGLPNKREKSRERTEYR